MKSIKINSKMAIALNKLRFCCRTIGNALEVVETLECLCGRGPADLVELVTASGEERCLLWGDHT